ncbi:nitroreductase family protein [Neisseria subflava]|uniref:nitroreductase family protein n=1 Tax=Neisseria subflava TaxID=28449 RepID=UPI00202AA35C|nr:nitroreductase family protein [Neisseria subflava]
MMQSKPTLDTILSHRSIRRFTSEPITDEILNTLVRAGQQASTSKTCNAFPSSAYPILR